MASERAHLRRTALALLIALLMVPTSARAGRDKADLRELAESGADFELAVAAQRRGELELAHDSYRAAIDKDPAFVEAMVNLARVHIELGVLTEAERWLIEARRVRPEYPGIDAVRALISLRSGDAARAAHELEAIRTSMPEDPETLINLGAALLGQGRAKAALEVLDPATRLDPSSAHASFNLALAHDRLGDGLRASYYYARFLELASTDDPERNAITERLVELRGMSPRSQFQSRSEPRPKLENSTASPDVAANGGIKQ